MDESIVGQQHRFIPACAGNTPAHRRRGHRPAVHPRVCGEHNDAADGHCTMPRFIPACAGNTPSKRRPSAVVGGSSPRVRGTRGRSSSPPAPPTVHPRVCGEHLDDVVGDAALHGSSPRVRGTHLAASAVRLHRRFIPACAGNTGPSSARRRPGAVHPRVCGEHGGRWPPRWKPCRFIPACAGNTVAGGRLDGSLAGSSPRVRGTQASRAHGGRRDRFIPACAGNTPHPPRGATATAVHPRVCGEHAMAERVYSIRIGSSPRVRGTRHIHAHGP